MDDIYIRQESLNINSGISAAVVGLGGIGYWVSKFLAMSGIEKLYLFDHDLIEAHNLNRLPFTSDDIGKNKAFAAKEQIVKLRPHISVYATPWKMNDTTYQNVDWVIDCTDNFESQLANQEIAMKNRAKYCKAGYDGMNFGIHNEIAEWGDSPDGYQIIPSWVVPAVMVAALTVAKVMKFEEKEVVTKVEDLFIITR